MDRLEFINAIFRFCNVKDEDHSRLKAYDLALSTKKNIDWDKLYKLFLKEAETKTLPTPKFFISKFPYCEIFEENFEGKKGVLRIIRNDDKFTDYVLCSGAGIPTLEETKERFRGVGIKDIKFYDETKYYLIGSKVIRIEG